MDELNEKITLHRDGESIRIHIPLKFKRRGGRKEIITPDVLLAMSPDRKAYQKPLVIALARAHRWYKLLEEGNVASISELARRFKVDASYISRIMRLTLLAPDIVEKFLMAEKDRDCPYQVFLRTYHPIGNISGLINNQTLKVFANCYEDYPFTWSRWKIDFNFRINVDRRSTNTGSSLAKRSR